MKSIVLFLLYFLPLFSVAQRDDFRGDSIEIKKIALHIIPDFTQKNIHGIATVYFTPKVNNFKSMRLDLLRMKITALTTLPQSCTYIYNDSLITIQYSTALKKDSNYTLLIEYYGVPMQDASAWGGWYWSGNYAFNLGVGFQSIPHNLGRAWFPCIDNFKVKQAFDITISCPQNLKAVSNGILLSQIDSGGYSTYSYHQPQPIPCYLASFNIGPYTIIADTMKSIDGRILQMRIAAEAKDSLNVKSSFQKLKPTVSYFEQLFGPYPFGVVGYSLVPFGSGAMEHSTNIAFPIYMIDGTLNYETIWAHELSHQWWGDDITCASAEEMWINEGWASYCERLFTEHFYGKDSYQQSIDDNHRYCLQFAHLIDEGYWSLDSVPQKYTYGTHSYQKGCDMIHSMRKMTGNDSIFSINCKRLLKEKKFTSVTTDTVLKYFATGTCELNALNELFKNPHYISNKIEYKHDEGSSMLEIKLATYNLKYPNNTCLPIELSGDGDKSYTPVFFSSIHSNGLYKIPGGVNTTVMFDEQNKFCDANTSHRTAINVTGALNFENEICNVTITQKYDTGFIYINRSWDYTGGYFFTKRLQSNSRGFWTVDGFNIEKLKGSIRFYYNGAALTNRSGYEAVDFGFITKSEDSLVLLYREKYDDPWEIMVTAVKYAASSTDKKGSFLVNEFKKGQYCIGQYDSKSVGIRAENSFDFPEMFPNPAKDHLTVLLPSDFINSFLEIIDLQGQVVFNQQNNDEKIVINTGRITKGIYFLRIQNGSHSIYKKLIID